MKLKYLALGLLTCVGMTSCSNDDSVNEGGQQGGDENINAAYLAVNIMNVGGTPTRADDFEDGTGDESKVTSVRFYFFDGSGNASNVIQNVTGKVNFADKTADELGMTNSGTATDNVTAISKAVVVLNGLNGNVPSSMVAIVNPTTDLGGTSKSLSDLKKITADYSSTDLTASGKFVMSNSVYANGTTAVCEIPISEYLRNSATAAENAPVNVYVERAVAKVTVTFTGADVPTNNRYLVSDASAAEKVYAEVVGWGIVGATDKGNLLKSINPSDWNTNLSWTSWNDAANFRSYWATSTGTVSNKFSYNSLVKKPGDNVYTQEHTPTAAITDIVDNDLTKIVVAAKLVDGSGNAKAIYKYLGSDSYTSEGDILTLVANDFNGDYFTKRGESYSDLAPGDLELKTGTELGQGSANTYKVYPQVRADVTLYTKNAQGGYEQVTDQSTINNILKAYFAEVWKDGMCYYTTTIEHLATSGIAKYGVVRNHVYKVNITDIQGFGTPVYDGNEEIEKPVVPTDDLSYLAAQINVLAWKVVSKDVTLGGSTTVGR